MALAPPIDETEIRDGAKAGEGEVVRQGAVEAQSFLFAILTQQPHAVRESRSGRAPGLILLKDRDGSPHQPVEAKASPQRFCATRADQPGQAKNLSGAQGQADF